MADPLSGLLVVAGGTKAGEFGLQMEEAKRKEEALNLERSQRELQFQQKTLANYDLTNKILDQQLVQASARGVGLGSPSLEATQRNTANISARIGKNLETEEDIFERNIRMEKENVQNSLASQLLGDVGDLASSAYGVKKSMPRTA